MNTTPPHPHTPASTIFSNHSHPSSHRRTLLALAIALAPLAACTPSNRSAPLTHLLSTPTSSPATPTTSDTATTTASSDQTPPPTPTTDLRSLPAFDARTGQPITWQTVLDRAASSRAILLGEVHNHTSGLEAAALLWQDLLNRPGLAPALALEFFERDHQIHLDDYLDAITTEDQFLNATGRNPGNYPPGHRAMLEAAREAGRPVIAANAPRRYVRLARIEGLGRLRALTADQRRLVTIPEELSTGPYRDRFFELMSAMTQSHAAPESEASTEPAPDTQTDPIILAFFTAQNVWDATMADSVADAVRTGFAPVLLVVGQFHTDFEGGTSTRLRARGISPVVISMVAADRDTLAEEDRNRADIVIYTGAPDP